MAEEVEFTVDGGGAVDTRGKVQYPHMLRLTVRRDDLASLISQLLRSLDKREDAHVALFGQLEPEATEELS